MSLSLTVRHSVIAVSLLLIGAALALLPLKWLVIGVPGMIIGTVVLIRPVLALPMLAFAIPFGSFYEFNLGGMTVGITEALIGLILAAWLARSVAWGETGWRRPGFVLPLLIFIGSTLFSLLNATALTPALKELFKWLEVLGIGLFVANTVDRHTRPWVLTAILLAGAAQAALGVYRFLTRSGPEGFVLIGRFMRAYGSFKQPNPFAGYLGLVAPFGFALSFTLLERKTAYADLGWLVWPAPVSFVLIAAGIVMSWSRGAWLAFAAAVGAMSLIYSRRGALFFALLVLVIAIAGLLGSLRLLPAAIVQRMTGFVPFANVQDVRAAEVTDENYAVLERLAHWESALDMWRDHPWIGVGLGNYETAYPAYALPKWPMALGHAHNYYLNIAAETGLIGLIGYLGLWGTVGWQTVQTVRRTSDPLSKALAVGALGMLVHLSVHNLLDNLWVHNMYIHVAMVLGLITVNDELAKG